MALVVLSWEPFLSTLSEGPNLAAETMSMQQRVLMEGKDFASSKEEIREIMQNIDLMPSKEIYKVRRDLGRSVGQLSKQSCGEISPTEYSRAGQRFLMKESRKCSWPRHCLMQQIRVVCLRELRLMLKDTSNTVRKEKRPSGNPDQSKAKKPDDGEKKKPDDGEKKKPTVTPEKVYFEALLKRAEEKNIDLGRFGRYYGGGRRRRP